MRTALPSLTRETRRAQLCKRSHEVVPPLLRLLGVRALRSRRRRRTHSLSVAARHAFPAAQKQLPEARCAATALVNMTGDRRAAEAALEKGAVERAMEHVRDDERAELRGLLASVLAAQPLCVLAARVADAACARR